MYRHGGTAESKANWIVRLGVQAEKGLAYLDGFGDLVASISTHQTFAVAMDPMGINGEEFLRKVASGSTQHSQMDLQRFSIGHGMGFEQVMHGSIASHER